MYSFSVAMIHTAEPWSIPANPGGPIDPDDHIGHGAELEEVVQATTSVGALVTGDRRMGKTSLLRKLEQVLDSEHVVLRISAETEDAGLFGSRLLDTLRGHHVFAEELKRWHLDIDVGYRGIRLRRQSEAGQEGTTDDLFIWAARWAAPAKLVVIVDEVTVLAGALEREREGGSLEFLRSFRRPRQELDNVVVILAGSVGIHHAVRSSEPVNDLRKVRVGPLAHSDAVFLARCLLLGEELETSDEAAVALAMAEQSDRIPYYLHHLAAAARREDGVLTPARVADLREAALTHPDDPWNIRHYRDRLGGYYGPDAELVAHMLDAFARVDGPLDLEGLNGLLASVDLEHRPGRDELIRLLDDLEADHYLDRRGDANAFSSRILRDAWRRIRRLS